MNDTLNSTEPQNSRNLHVDDLVILSGGMDSATLYWRALSSGRAVAAIVFDYGQRHGREIDAAWKLVKAAKAEFGDLVKGIDTVNISEINTVFGENSQTADVAVPHGAYDDETMKVTVVPNRNMIFAAIATAHAITIGAERLLTGVHAGDHAIYPDCRPEFVQALALAIKLGNDHQVALEAPYVHWNKGQICHEGIELGVPYELTWTCYEGGELPCGKCGSCVERAEAFKSAGTADPLLAKAGEGS